MDQIAKQDPFFKDDASNFSKDLEAEFSDHKKEAMVNLDGSDIGAGLFDD